MNYVRIPSDIINSSDNNSLLIPIYIELFRNRSLRDTARFSMRSLTESIGLAPNTRVGRSYDRCIQTLNHLNSSGYFVSCPQLKATDKAMYEIELKAEMFDCPDRFALIYFNELDAIHLHVNKSFKETTPKSTYANLLRLLAYLRLNYKTYNINQNKVQFCYQHMKQIYQALNVTSITLSRWLETLEKLHLVFYQQLSSRREYDKGWYNPPTVFTNYSPDNDAQFNAIQEYLFGKYKSL